MVEMNACSTAAKTNASVKTPKNRYCEICKIAYGTPWNFKRHVEEKHAANNTAEITAKREKQNERRNISRKERYANDPTYKKKMKQLSATGRQNKRARVEIEEETILNSDPDSDDKVDGNEEDTVSLGEGAESEDKVNGNEEDTVSLGEGAGCTDSAEENKAKQVATHKRAFQVYTEPLSKEGIEDFFRSRSSAPGSFVISREAVAV
jgi:hypothetical protein